MPLTNEIVEQLTIVRDAIDVSLRRNTRNCRLVDLKARLQLGRFIYSPQRYSLWHVYLWFIGSASQPQPGPKHALLSFVTSPAEIAVAAALKAIQPTGLKKYWLLFRHYLFRAAPAVWSFGCLIFLAIATQGFITGWIQIVLPIFLLTVLAPFVTVFSAWSSEKMAYEGKSRYLIGGMFLLAIAALTLPNTFTANMVLFLCQLEVCLLLLSTLVHAVICRAARLANETILAREDNAMDARNAIIQRINNIQLEAPRFEYVNDLGIPPAAAMINLENEPLMAPEVVPLRAAPDFWSLPVSQPQAIVLGPGNGQQENKGIELA